MNAIFSCKLIKQLNVILSAIKIFTDPEFATNISHTEDELGNIEEGRQNFVGEYCERCSSQFNRYWCNASDWSKDLEIDNNNKNEENLSNPNLERQLTPLTSPTKPPSGWSEFRKRTISKISSNGLKVKDCRIISLEEFHSM